MTIESYVALLKLYEQLFYENYALRATLTPLSGWDDSVVDAHKEKARTIYGKQFEVVFQHANNPAKLNAVLENMLRSKKPN